MDEPSVEEIVAIVEGLVSDAIADNCAVPIWMLNALLASWRERGEVLREIDIAARQIIEGSDPVGTCLAIRGRLAALKDKP